jgi:DsbE subfamily thiol:disulfide oxidoreductase
MRRIAAALALALCAASCGDTPDLPGSVGKPAPAYAARNLAGDSVDLTRYQGRVVLLNIWATWCPPCRKETPALQALHERYGKRGLSVVGVSIDIAGAGNLVSDFMREYGVTYGMLHDPDDRVSSVFGINGVPSTFLIDRKGIVRWRHMGAVRDDDPELRKLIERHIQ